MNILRQQKVIYLFLFICVSIFNANESNAARERIAKHKDYVVEGYKQCDSKIGVVVRHPSKKAFADSSDLQRVLAATRIAYEFDCPIFEELNVTGVITGHQSKLIYRGVMKKSSGWKLEDIWHKQENSTDLQLTKLSTYEIRLPNSNNCISFSEKSLQIYKENCKESRNSHFFLNENRVGNDQYQIQANAITQQNKKTCLDFDSNSRESKATNLLLKPCDHSSFWTLYHYQEGLYQVRLDKSTQCLSHDLKLITCIKPDNNYFPTQLFLLDYFGKDNRKLVTNQLNFNQDLQHRSDSAKPDNSVDNAFPKNVRDTSYSLRMIEKHFKSKKISSDVAYNQVVLQLSNLNKIINSHTFFKSIDTALIIAYEMIREGEFEYGVGIAKRLEPYIKRFAEVNRLDNDRYRSQPNVAEFLAFGRALLHIYNAGGEYVLARPWAEIHAKYKPTGVNAPSVGVSSIKNTVDAVEIILKQEGIDENSINIAEKLISDGFNVSLNQAKTYKEKLAIIHQLPVAWDARYGQHTDQFPTTFNIFQQENSRLYARAHMYLGYIYAQMGKDKKSYLQLSEKLFDSAHEILNFSQTTKLVGINKEKSPYWEIRLQIYAAKRAIILHDLKRLKLHLDYAFKLLPKSDHSFTYLDLRSKLYEMLLQYYLSKNALHDAYAVAVEALSFYDEHIKSINVASALNKKRIISYKRVLDKSLDITYDFFALATQSRKNKILQTSLSLAQKMRITHASVASLQQQSRVVKGLSNQSKLIKDFQNVERQIIIENSNLLSLESGPIKSNQSIKFNELYTQYEKLKAEIAVKHPMFLQNLGYKSAKLDAIQSSLDNSEGLLLYRFNGDRAYLWTITKKKINWEILESSPKDLNGLVDKVRNSLESKFDYQSAEKLYKLAVKRADSFLNAQSIKTLFIVSDGSLQQLPFHLLSIGHSKWFSDRYAQIYLPNIGMKVFNPIGRNNHFDNKYFALADPANLQVSLQIRDASNINSTYDPFSRSANSQNLCELAALPETRDEVEAIANELGVKSEHLLLGENATEENLQKIVLSSYQTIHFATHAVFSNEASKQSGLVLVPKCNQVAGIEPTNDGLLSTEEIASLNLRADNVILSACNSAGGKHKGGEALSGLATSFIFAGAKSIIASHWPVNSKVTKELMIRFNTLWLKKRFSKAVALQKAMQEIRIKNPVWRHPKYWAPFVIVSPEN